MALDTDSRLARSYFTVDGSNWGKICPKKAYITFFVVVIALIGTIMGGQDIDNNGNLFGHVSSGIAAGWVIWPSCIGVIGINALILYLLRPALPEPPPPNGCAQM